MADSAGHNFKRVIFRAGGAGGQPVDLKLDGEWTITAGLKPNVNSALVSYEQYDKLGEDPGRYGQLEFYFNNNPDEGGAADVVLQQHRIVDVEATRIAAVKTGGGPDAEEVLRIVEYRLFIADRRDRFVAPRGGCLRKGEINKRPISTRSDKDGGGKQDANRQDLVDTDQLVGICLSAMGIIEETAWESLKDKETIYDVQWFANHAPTELEKILKQIGYVFLLLPNGKFSIERMGEGATPEPDNALPTLSLPGLDRRGRSVVFASAPNPILDTVTAVGPDDKGDFFFVVQDTDDQWKKLADASFFKSTKPIDLLKNLTAGAVDTGSGGVPDEKFRTRLWNQLFRCIAFDPSVYGYGAVRRTISEQDKAPQEIEVSADSLARVRPDGSVQNADGARVQVHALMNDGRVVFLEERLLSLKKGSSAVDLFSADVKPIDTGNVTIKFTQEVWEQDSAGHWVPKFFLAGFQEQLGGIEDLDEAAAENVLNSPDGVIVPRPDLQLLRSNGDDQNKGELMDRAREAAPSYLKDDKAFPELVQAVGYAPGSLSGAVSEIKYQQDPPLTSFHVNTFYLPRGTYLKKEKDGGGGGGGAMGNAYPMQAQTERARTADGATSATQPVAPVSPSFGEAAAGKAVKVKLTGPTTGRGSYFGVITTGNSTADPNKAVSEPDGQTNQGTSVIIRNLREDVSVILGTGPDHMLKPGEYLAQIVGSGTNGLIVDIESSRCGNSNIANLSHIGDTSTAAFTDSAPEGSDRQEVNVSLLTRCVYSSGDDAFYEFTRVFSFQCGLLTAVSTETRTTIFTTGDCNP